MAPITLAGLPKDVLLHIIDYIPQPTHLKALCLTCSWLRLVALPKLYRRVKLSYDSPYKFAAGAGFFDINHPGHAHVRSVDIDCDWDFREEAQLLVKLLLQLLPRNGLHELWLNDVGVDEATAMLLITQQRSLKRRETGPILFDFCPLLASNLSKSGLFDSLLHLTIPREIHSILDLKACNTIIQRAPRLCSLAIKTVEWSVEETMIQGLYDTASATGILSSTIFSHLPSDGSRKLTELTSFHLEEADIEFFAPTLTKFIDFHRLTSLTLAHCMYTNNFLLALSQVAKNKGCMLKRFQYVDDLANPEVDPRALQDFLYSFKGLESLAVVSEGAESLDLLAILHHRSTLEQLSVHLDEQDYVTGSRLVSEEYLHKTGVPEGRLKQIGVPFPKTLVSHSDIRTWDRYCAVMTALLELRSLDVIRILNFPDPRPGFWLGSRDDLERGTEGYKRNSESYLHNLDEFATRLAQHMVNGMNGSKLPMFCFGQMSYSAIRSTDGSIFIGPCCYFPSTHPDIYGNPHPVAVRISLAEARYIEPEHFLLEDNSY